ncbi:hypothetical protein AK812_SmicGene47 [Symbiodinium microadriaticum]|uniref:Uncharacterized protein n=1 Tax=Symbiodinium microadriaticum TaxID=2951 RepID=A0A1Q9F7I4_SYMMI|nr:hypothetical protein AK812_SmicGene47 [Symbiodinium microadriaticum]
MSTRSDMALHAALVSREGHFKRGEEETFRDFVLVSAEGEVDSDYLTGAISLDGDIPCKVAVAAISEVQAARAAGISEEHLGAMSRLLQKRPGKTENEDVEEAVGLAAEPGQEGDPVAGTGGGQDVVAQALVKLAGIVDALAQGKSRKKALQKTLKENYQEIYNSVERLMKEDLGSQTEGPGLPQSSGTFRGWVEHRSRIPAIPTNCRLAWILAGALHTLNQGDIPGAKATLGLGLASLDRLAIDRGQWLVAAECSLEPLGPPISCFQRHQLPTLEEAQHSRLLDPRWIEAFYQKVKDLDDYVERKLARPPRAPDSIVVVRELVETYKDEGLLPHPGKTFYEEQIAEIWGSRLDGDKGLTRRTVIRICPELAEELVLVAILSSVAVSDLRLHNSPHVFSADASDSGIGITTAEPPVGGFCRRHPLWILLGAGLDYREGLRKAIPGDRHINILETKALMLVEKEVSHEGFNRRAFGLSDSQVALAVAVKGRSFSAARNEVLQDSLAVHIDCNSILSSGFLPTEFNSADGHSRNRKCGQRMLEWPAGLLESLAADLMLGWRLTGDWSEQVQRHCYQKSSDQRSSPLRQRNAVLVALVYELGSNEPEPPYFVQFVQKLQTLMLGGVDPDPRGLRACFAGFQGILERPVIDRLTPGIQERQRIEGRGITKAQAVHLDALSGKRHIAPLALSYH